MKPNALLRGAMFIVVVLAVMEGYASEKQSIAVEDAMKKFEGTYENDEYSSWEKPHRCDITFGMTIVEWARANQKKPSWIGDLSMVECWTDAEGNIYFKLDVSYRNGGHNQALWKLHNTGGILEINYTQTVGHGYPENIEPDPDPNASPKMVYVIYYRQ